MACTPLLIHSVTYIMRRIRKKLDLLQMADSPASLMGHQEYDFILELLGGLLTIYVTVLRTLAQETRLHCEHWWIPFFFVLIVSVAGAVAVFFQLKKMPRSARQVCLLALVHVRVCTRL